ncbi:WxL protein peptidoglycan domain-containing protein [Streptomyces sp. NPDC059224]|uniref:WxL protein peptidoglycan domain-containing protein n=1 Tax=Streptomyces sp. NPDC059224 TaxID=3346775 RepID=UPI0036C95BFA
MRRVKPYVLLLSLLLLGVLGPLGTAGPARAADNGSWSVYPVASKIAARPYFYLSLDPGQKITDKVAVANKTGKPLTFRLYAADAYNTARDGGFAVRTVKERMRGVGAWAKTGRARVTVPPHGTVTVPFTLHVPRDAEPGDHPGAIVALDERVDPGTGSLALGVQRAVGARVYLRVSGPTLPAVAVENVHLTHHQPLVPGLGDSTATVSYTLHNTGNVTLDPKVRLRAEGLFGRTLLSRDLTGVPSELLPGERVRLTAAWRNAPQFDWGNVTLTASAAGTEESASASFLALPWLVVGLAFVAGVAGGVLLARARRGRRGRGLRGLLRGRRGRARPSAPGRPSPPAVPTPSRPRSSPSARP